MWATSIGLLYFHKLNVNVKAQALKRITQSTLKSKLFWSNFKQRAKSGTSPLIVMLCNQYKARGTIVTHNPKSSYLIMNA